MAIILLSCKTSFETEDNIREIAQRAYLAKYQGSWRDVQVLLEQTYNFQEYLIKYYSPEEIFGHVLKNLESLCKEAKIKNHTLQATDRYKRKVYRRGYDDKGTLRPYHQPKLPGGKEIERDDRRSKVAHPLLSDWNKKLQDRDVELFSSQRELEFYLFNKQEKKNGTINRSKARISKTI